MKRFVLALAGQIFGSQGRVQIIATYKERIRERTLQLIEYYSELGGTIEFLYKRRQ